jgi:hypothetical protein
VVVSKFSDVDFLKNIKIRYMSSPSAVTAAVGMLNLEIMRLNIMHVAMVKRRRGERGAVGPVRASAGM